MQILVILWVINHVLRFYNRFYRVKYFTYYLANVVELRGECEPFQFTLDPPAIFVPGATYMHSTTRKSFRVKYLLFIS